MEWDDDENQQPCEEECCRIVLKDNGKAVSVSCKSTHVKARALCELYPVTNLKEDFEVHDEMIKAESQERQEMQIQIWEAMMDVNRTVNEMDATVGFLKSKSDVHAKDLKSASKDKTALYVLFSINIVALLGLGAFVFVIWRRVNNNQ